MTERLGLGPEDCIQRNRALVYARMTGWGQDGPLAQTAGHDINYIAIAGVLGSIGTPSVGPILPLNIIGDYAAGGAMLAFAIVAGVLEARQSGDGQVIDASMMEGASFLMTKYHGFASQGTWEEGLNKNFLDGAAPYYRVYETADGEYMAVGALEPAFFNELMRLVGLDPADYPDRTNKATWPSLTIDLGRAFKGRTRHDWEQVFDGTNACVTPVLSMSEAVTHPHAVAREGFLEVGGLRQPRPTPRFSRTPSEVRGPATRAGDGAAESLRTWGLPEEDIALFASRERF